MTEWLGVLSGALTLATLILGRLWAKEKTRSGQYLDGAKRVKEFSDRIRKQIDDGKAQTLLSDLDDLDRNVRFLLELHKKSRSAPGG